MDQAEQTKKRLSLEGIKRARRILSYIKPYKWHFIIALSLIIIGNTIFMLIPGVCGEMINVAVGKAKYGCSINQLALVTLILILAQALFSFVRTILFAIVSEKGMGDIRNDLYKKLISQPIVFFEENRVGEITSRITTDVGQIQGMLSITIAEFLRQMVTISVGLGILIYLTPRLSFIMLLIIPVVAVMAMFFGRYIRKLAKKRQEALADANTIVDETLHNISAVKSFTNELFESKRYTNAIDIVIQIALDFARKRGLFFAFIIAILFGSIIFILWRGALMVESGQMESGTLFSFLLYTGIIGGAIGGIGNLYANIASAIGATDRVFEILDRESELEISDEKHNLELKGKIEFKNIDFAYPTRLDVPVLKQLNLDIHPGTKVALVGHSGNGKSTIALLLLRFYELVGGEILIDGKNINTFDRSAYRSNIAIVPQEIMLFGGTIYENIIYGRANATKEEVIKAAEQSNCMEFINEFPEGFDTIVGERGVKLSGGQKQRVAIARAILKDPAILILDEATSSLDAESEQLVQNALEVLMEGRTSIIIAHRLATIKDVDKILVIDNGKIIQEGVHEELMAKEGVYQQLASLQFQS